jgi:hypothetical protein
LAHQGAGAGLIGVPGTLESSTAQFIEALPFFIGSFLQLLRAFDQACDEASSSERQLHQVAGTLLRDARNAVCTLENLENVVSELRPDCAEQSAEFRDMTSDHIERRGQKTRAVRDLFRRLSQTRRDFAKSVTQLQLSGQTSITAYRQKLAGIAQLLKLRNRTLRDAMNTIAAMFSRVGERIGEANATLSVAVQKIDFTADFRGFIATAKIARFDLSDVAFVPYPVNPTAFAGIKARLELPLPQIYPIGMAKVVCDYYADGANQISCKAGKSMLLMERMDDDWVYVMSPVTFVTGFVPRLCLRVIGRGLAVMLREQAGVQPGDCVAVIEEGTHGACTVETAFGHQLTVSKGNLGIIYS